MNKVESDLEKSKSLREKQSKDFIRQIDDIKNENKKNVKKIKVYELKIS